MTYAKRILSTLLVLCLLGNTAITVFASDTDGGDELPPVDTATEEPVVDESPPVQGEEPPAEPFVVTDDGETSAEITAANDIVMPMASGVEIVRCGNAILKRKLQ